MDQTFQNSEPISCWVPGVGNPPVVRCRGCYRRGIEADLSGIDVSSICDLCNMDMSNMNWLVVSNIFYFP